MRRSAFGLSSAALLASTLLLSGCGGGGASGAQALAPGLYRAEVSGSRPLGREGDAPAGAFANDFAVAQVDASGAVRLFANYAAPGIPGVELYADDPAITGAMRGATLSLDAVRTEGSLSVRGRTLVYEAPGAALFERVGPPTTLRARLAPLAGGALGATFIFREGRYEGDLLYFGGDGRLSGLNRVAGELAGDRLALRAVTGSDLTIGARLLPGGATEEVAYRAGLGFPSVPPPPPPAAWSGMGNDLALQIENPVSVPGRALLLLRRVG